MEYRIVPASELYHHGVKGQKWGVRRYQNKDGSYTPAGKKRYGSKVVTGIKQHMHDKKVEKKATKQLKRDLKDARRRNPQGADAVNYARGATNNALKYVGGALVGSAVTYALAKSGRNNAAAMAFASSHMLVDGLQYTAAVGAGLAAANYMLGGAKQRKEYSVDERLAYRKYEQTLDDRSRSTGGKRNVSNSGGIVDRITGHIREQQRADANADLRAIRSMKKDVDSDLRDLQGYEKNATGLAASKIPTAIRRNQMKSLEKERSILDSREKESVNALKELDNIEKAAAKRAADKASRKLAQNEIKDLYKKYGDLEDQLDYGKNADAKKNAQIEQQMMDIDDQIEQLKKKR